MMDELPLPAEEEDTTTMDDDGGAADDDCPTSALLLFSMVLEDKPAALLATPEDPGAALELFPGDELAAVELLPGMTLVAPPLEEDVATALLLPIARDEDTITAEELPLEDEEDDDEAPPLEEELPGLLPTSTHVPSAVHTKPPRQSVESRHSFLLPVQPAPNTNTANTTREPRMIAILVRHQKNSLPVDSPAAWIWVACAILG